MQKIHLKAPDNWINDPNGFIYYKGEYHLFYQYFPYSPHWGTMHWGHAVSKDLVHWGHRGVALFPTVDGDRNGCFSGSAIEHNGKMYLIYTGVKYLAWNPENIHLASEGQMESSQMMISSDNGYHFDNWKGKKVIIPPIRDQKIGHRCHTRDPKVWRGKDAWYVILGSTMERKQGEVLFFRSKDLENWEYINKALFPEEMGWMCECPDYFETKGGKVLLASAMGIRKKDGAEWGARQEQSVCCLVDFEEETCTMKIPEQYQFLDYGFDLYAAQTTPDRDGNRVMTAWLRMPKPVEDKWIGMYCAPRIVEVKDGHIYFRLHPNIRQAFSKEIQRPEEADEAGYRAELELREGEEINLGGLLIYRKENRIFADRSKVYPEQENSGQLLSVTPEVKEGFRLEILVDEHLAEIFVNDGEYVVSNVVYGLEQSFLANVSGKVKFYTME